MKKAFFQDVNTLKINCKKSVFARGWEKDEIEVRYPENKECIINNDQGLLEINADSYCIISLPKNVKLSIEKINGNFDSAGELGLLNLETISGNCTIQSADSLVIEKVGGNCKIGFIGDDAKIEKVGGNLSFIDENGTLEIDGVGGNLSGQANNLSLISSVGGNIKINANQFSKGKNELRAGGSIKLNISDLENTVINAKAGGVASINYQENSEKFLNGKFEKKFDSGEKTVELRAGGNIKISDQKTDFEINQNFGSTDDAYVDEIEQKFKMRALQSSGFDFSDLFDFDSEIGEQIREKTNMADEKIRSAMEKMERKFSFKEEFGNIPRPPRPPSPPKPTRSPDESQSGTTKLSSISKEEKIMILQMLQDGKINAEEADRLLNALEQF